MAERSVVVRLQAAVAEYKRGMGEAKTATESVGTASEDAARKGSRGLSELLTWTDKNEQSLNTLTTQAGLVGAGLTATAALAVKKYADFDQAMSNVIATGDDARTNQDALRQAALDAGAATVFSATESADAITEMAKAGVSATDVLAGGLTGALDLASAGSLEIADAAGIASTVMNQFGLSGKDVTHIADVLAASAGKANGEVADFGLAMKYVGPVASQLGVSLEETSGTLALLAQNGLLADSAGTGLRGVMMSLTAPTKAAQSTLDEYNISAFDAQGNFVGLADLAGQLHDRLGGLTEAERSAALGRIFGNEQITTARILYAQGADEVRKWTEAVDDSGYAGEVARTKLDNLKGDLEGLSGAFETAMIKLGEGGDEPLRALTKSATDVVNRLAEMPAWAQTTTLAIVGGGGLALLGVAGLLKLATATSEGMLAMQRLGVMSEATTDKIASGVGRATRVVAGLGAAFVTVQVAGALMSATIDEAAIGTEELQARLDGLAASGANVAEVFSDIDTPWIDHGLVQSGIDDVESFRQSLDILADPNFVQRAQMQALKLFGPLFDSSELGQQAKRFDEIGDSINALVSSDLPSATKQFSALYEAAGNTEEGGRRLLAVMPGLRDTLIGLADGAGMATDDSTLLSIILGQVSVASSDAADATGAATDAVTAQTAATEAATKAQTDWLEAVGQTDAAFVDPLGAYDALVQKNKDAATAAADATSSTKDSWEDFSDQFPETVDGYLAELERMVQSQTDWERNMLLLSGRVSQGVIDELRDMGPEGAPLVAQLVTASDEQLARMEDLFGQRSATATSNFAANLQGAGPVVQAAAAQLGQDAANEIAAKLADGVTTIPEVIEQYGLVMKQNPLDVPLNTALASEQLAGILGEINSAEGTVTVAGDMGPAGKVLDAATAAIDAAAGTVTIYGDDGEAVTTLTGFTSQVDTAGGTVTIRGNDEQGRSTVATLTNWTDAQGASIKVGANTSQAQNDIGNLVRQDWQVTIRARLDAANTTEQLQAIQRSAHVQVMQAHGSVLDFFANGSENHVAQIAPAGAWRVWAEPETGGEGYIPLAESKRARSEEILGSIADRFGGQYIPAGARRYDRGSRDHELTAAGLLGAAGGAGAAYAGATTASVPVSTRATAGVVNPVKVVTQSLDGARLVGTLDLGNGLTGLIDARVDAGLAQQRRDLAGTRGGR